MLLVGMYDPTLRCMIDAIQNYSPGLYVLTWDVRARGWAMDVSKCVCVCVCVVEHASVRGRWEASGSQDAVVTGKSDRSHNLVIQV